MNNEKNRYSNGLVGMRVIATLGIALYHFELSFPFVEGKQIMSTAYLFVEFFLIMSGFLMAMGLSKEDKSLFIVIVDRFIRLWPAYIMGLLLLPAVYALTWFNGNYVAWLKDSYHLKSFIVEFVMLQCTGIAGLKYINGPAWYVSAMFIVTPIVYFFIKMKKVGSIIAAILTLLIYSITFYTLKSPDMPMEGFIFTYIPLPLLRALAGMLLGVVSYNIFVEIRTFINRIPVIFLTLFEGMFIIWIFRMCYFRKSSFVNWVVLIPFIGLLILMMSENRGVFSKILGTKTLEYLAEISYAFYIMQSFCSNFLACFITDIKQPYSTFFYLSLNFGMAVIIHEVWERKLASVIKQLFRYNKVEGSYGKNYK